MVVLVLTLCVVAAGCTGEDRSAERSDPASRTVTLVVGHCEIEPFPFAGIDWVESETAIGSGGQQPDEFTGRGTFTKLSETSALFTDQSGLEVAFKPYDGVPRACD